MNGTEQLLSATMPVMKTERISMLECDDGTKKPVMVCQFDEHCYFIVSYSITPSEYGDVRVSVTTTFLYDHHGVAAEWEPCYGPIQLWRQCHKDWTAKDGSSDIAARRHWFYEYVENRSGMWSQLAVDREDLKGMLTRGYYDSIFAVLRRWAENATTEDEE